MEVTPLGEGGTKIADVAALEKILHLLMEDPDEHLPPALEQFFTHLGVRSWEDMVVFSAHDVEEEIKESKHVIDEAKAGSTKGEEIVKKVGLDKKIVPTLEKFDDEDFYAFQDSTMNWLGQAGLACYLTDADVMSSNKEAGKAVFYAICSSLQGRDARCFLSDGIV